jgi:alpha-tubulin suppressor-like RCC1 family protein
LHSCAVRTDGSLVCWGAGTTAATDCRPANLNCGQALAPDGLFREVAAGYTQSCGVRDDGSVTCWGYDANGQLDVPSGLRVLE